MLATHRIILFIVWLPWILLGLQNHGLYRSAFSAPWGQHHSNMTYGNNAPVNVVNITHDMTIMHLSLGGGEQHYPCRLYTCQWDVGMVTC